MISIYFPHCNLRELQRDKQNIQIQKLRINIKVWEKNSPCEKRWLACKKTVRCFAVAFTHIVLVPNIRLTGHCREQFQILIFVSVWLDN